MKVNGKEYHASAIFRVIPEKSVAISNSKNNAAKAALDEIAKDFPEVFKISTGAVHNIFAQKGPGEAGVDEMCLKLRNLCHTKKVKGPAFNVVEQVHDKVQRQWVVTMQCIVGDSTLRTTEGHAKLRFAQTKASNALAKKSIIEVFGESELPNVENTQEGEVPKVENTLEEGEVPEQNEAVKVEKDDDEDEIVILE